MKLLSYTKINVKNAKLFLYTKINIKNIKLFLYTKITWQKWLNVATKLDKKIYIQVAFSIPNEDTKNREFGAYNVINDNYPKYVITLDKLTYEFNGIKHVNLIDFLLDDDF